MSLLAALSPLLTQATNLTGAAVGAQNQANEIQRQRALQNQQLSTQQALLQYQLKREQDQDALKQAIEGRRAQEAAVRDRIMAVGKGMVPFGAPAKDTIPSAVPLPANPTVSPTSQPSEGEDIPGAPQRKLQLEAQEGPGIDVHGEQYGLPHPKPPKPEKKQYKAVLGKNGIWTSMDEETGLDPQGHPVEGVLPTAKGPHRKIERVGMADGIHEITFDEDGNKINDVLLGQGPPTGKGGAGGSSSGAQVPVADMEERFGEVAQHATDLGNGKWKITQPMQAREAFDYANARESAAGHPSMLHQTEAGVSSVLGLGGDDYGRYQAMMNSYRALGDDVAKVFKGRQNEEAVLREVALAQLTPQDYGNPQVVQQKLNRLRHVIDLAKLNNPSQQQIPQQGGGAPKNTVQSQDEYDHLRSLGMTSAQIRARYNIGSGVQEHDD